MSFRKLVVLGFILTGCLLASAAHAQVDQQDNGTTDPCFSVDYSWEQCGWEAGSPYNPPMINSCTAYGSLNQRCRQCARAYYDDGTYKGYDVCAYTDRSASCDCKNSGTSYCIGSGSCTYKV